MMTVKLTVETSAADAIAQALANIEAGNKATSEAKKLIETGKEFLSSQLLSLRKIEVEDLPIGEIVAVAVNGSPAFNVLIGKQNRLDVARLTAEKPAIVAEYKKDFPTVSYKRAV